jgi:Cdc6-like AAA superfamily ATPase
MTANRVGQVISSAPSAISVEISDLQTFESSKENLQIGRYLRIAQGNNDYTIAIIKNIKGTNTADSSDKPKWNFLVECQAIGPLINNERFDRGSPALPVPTEPVFAADKSTLDKVFAGDSTFDFQFGTLALNKDIDFRIDGDRFFSKHIAVVGSTGSGKSCTVAKVLHDIVGINDNKNVVPGAQNNSHILIFDIHDEYRAAFSHEDVQSFTLNPLGIDGLKMPYWLMNSEELESMFIESNEENSHNQVSQFKLAVIQNK